MIAVRLDDDFRALAEQVDLEALDEERGAVFGIHADGRLAFTNAAWDEFAALNGGGRLTSEWPLGRNVFEAIPDALQAFYRDGWDWVTSSGHPWSHTYECSTPEEYRRFRMTSYPVGEEAAAIVVNSLIAARPWDAGAASTLPREDYREASGRLTQCPHCRRTQHPRTLRWDWVPEWVHRWPDLARAALCPFCLGYHYYDIGRGAPRPVH